VTKLDTVSVLAVILRRVLNMITVRGSEFCLNLFFLKTLVAELALSVAK
jgi:hypothetical protein